MKRIIFSLFTAATFFLAACSSQQEAGPQQAQAEIHLLDAKAFSDKLNEKNNIQLVDVRTPGEFSGGYIAGAVNMDFNGAGFSEQISQLDKTKPVMVYCKGGGRSGRAAEMLKTAGFSEVYDLDGGIMAWENQELPVTTGNNAVNAKSNLFTQKDLDRLLAEQPLVMIDYYAGWCAPCKKMEPLLENISSEYKGKMIVKRINVDEAADLCKAHNIEGIPVVAIYKNGAEIKRVKGEQSEEDLRNLAGELLK